MDWDPRFAKCERVWSSSTAGGPAAAPELESPPWGKSGRLRGVTPPDAPGNSRGGGPRGGPPDNPNVLVKPSIAGGAAAPGAPTAHLIPIANRVYQPAQTPT